MDLGGVVGQIVQRKAGIVAVGTVAFKCAGLQNAQLHLHIGGDRVVAELVYVFIPGY